MLDISLSENKSMHTESRWAASFKQNKNKPVHRWYYFKEGFSSELVKQIISEYYPNNGSVIDCFSGSATTALTCQELNIKSIGVEINPFFKFIGEVKLRNGYDTCAIKNYKEQIFKRKNYGKDMIEAPQLSSFKTCFSKNRLQEILNFKAAIMEIDELRYKKLFLFALASVLEKTSKVIKDGKGLKFVKKPRVRVASLLNEKIEEMIADVEWKHENNTNDRLGKIVEGDARNLKFPRSSFSLAVFSPPYLNSFDYTEVYKLELWLLEFVKEYDAFRKLSKSTLRSHLSAEFDKKSIFSNRTLENTIGLISKRIKWNQKIPDMVRSYFNDMKKTFECLHRILNDDARCIVVVGNSSYTGITIPTDLFLGKIAEEAGFSFDKLKVIRKLKTSAQQAKISDKQYMRESIVILKNEK